MFAAVLAASLAASPIDPDKLGHFAIGAAVTGAVYALNAQAGAPRNVRMWNSILFPVGLALAWEVATLRAGRGTEAESMADLSATVGGTIFALGVSLFADLALTGRKTEDCVNLNGVLVCVD